ncbi:MAG TPA: MFS transporter [Candidatus Nesterenkonia stercoripullorum]|uniref:MFS transporter n=1 Tax=Candidatus Nesterenkonia stercoripullorum TaxID=2838701 RepID=A0A9D1USV6_9MICC|nr:MFS transporter [Candidatus Nesterenkonia stercoripullorum]
MARHASAHSAKTPIAGYSKRKVLAWSLWDWGSASFNAVMVTFVFGTYLASEAFGADDRGTQYLANANAVGGLIIAATAPIIGMRSDRGGRRKFWLSVNTIMVCALTAACFFVRPEEGYLLLGVVLLAAGNVFFEFAEINYNAMLVDIAPRERMGRVSGIGWGAGYLGGIFLLLIAYVGFIGGESPFWFGVGDENALNIRVVALFAALWFILWALPLLLSRTRTAGTPPDGASAGRTSIVGSYRELFRTLRDLWANDRNTLIFLISSAIYRDGVGAVFAYGAILGTTVYGIDPGAVLFFGIFANVVAAVGAFLGGWLDDRLGPRPVIAASLIAMLTVGCVVYFFSDGRQLTWGGELIYDVSPQDAFWVMGLLLCFFVGPVQSASRAFLARMVTPERAGELFGLYATTGRSVSFLAPLAIGIALALTGSNDSMVLAIMAVIALGLLSLTLVKNPQPVRAYQADEG